MASEFDSFRRDGFDAYGANRCREAALHFARAGEAARLLRDPAPAFEAGVWEAHSWENAGELKRAYALLFNLLAEADDSVPVEERWIAEKHVYEIWLRLGRRTRAEREERLRRIKEYAARHPNVPPGDLPQLHAELEMDGARWVEALTHWEVTWAGDDNRGRGYVKSRKALGAIEALLRLGREEEALRWLDLLSQTDQARAYGRAFYHHARALYALHAPPDPTALEGARCALDEDLTSTDWGRNATGRHLIARLWLLLRQAQNPADPFHPARAALRQRPETGRDWDRALCLADYYLACLRFLVGIAPCDDYYHRHPSPIPANLAPADPEEFRRRLRRLRAALTLAAREAADIDERNQTDWYSTEVRAREERLDLILTALVGRRGTFCTTPR